MDNFFVISLIKSALVAFIFLTVLAYLQWVERKVIAHIQVRPGPYRVGPHGLLQPLADVIKLITKEGVVPPHANATFSSARASSRSRACASHDTGATPGLRGLARSDPPVVQHV